MEYVIKVKWDDIKDMQSDSPIEKEMQVDSIAEEPEVKPTKVKSNDMMSALKTAGVIYAVGRQAAQLGVSYISNRYEISGETLKADRLNTKFTNATNHIGLGLGVVGSIATGNPVVIAMTAYALAQRAMNLGLETQRYQGQLAGERYRSEYYTNRLVKDISEVR
jgi:hypothetical protein